MFRAHQSLVNDCKYRGRRVEKKHFLLLHSHGTQTDINQGGRVNETGDERPLLLKQQDHIPSWELNLGCDTNQPPKHSLMSLLCHGHLYVYLLHTYSMTGKQSKCVSNLNYLAKGIFLMWVSCHTPIQSVMFLNPPEWFAFNADLLVNVLQKGQRTLLDNVLYSEACLQVKCTTKFWQIQ